jgi:hypothetical protein
MGWNTSILFLNDGMDAIKSNPQQVVDNILKMMGDGYTHDEERPGNFRELRSGDDLPVGNHVNNMILISRDHADVTNLVCIGANHFTTLLRGCHTLRGNHYEKNDQITLLKAAAEKLGYRLSKIPER